MPGVFDWIHSGLLGQPDAYDEAKQFLNQQARANAGAVAGDPNAPFSGGFATPPVAQPADPNAPPKAPPIGVAQPGPGEPQAYQTPPSWGSVLLDLSRQQQQEQQFNRSLGGIFSTLSQPINRERVSHTFDTTPMDPLQFGKEAMDLSSQQQGQDRVNQIARIVNDPVQGPALAAKLNMDWGTLKAGIVTDPGMIGKIAQTLGTPTEMQRNLGAAQAAIEKQVKLEHPDWTPAQVQAEVNRQAPPSMLLSGVGNLDDQAYRRYAADEQAAGRTPMNPEEWKIHTKDITENKDQAQQDWPTVNQKITTTEGMVDDLLGNTKKTLEALQTWRPTEGRFAQYVGPDAKVEHAALILKQLKASLAAENLAGVKNMRNVTEFNTLAAAVTAALDPAQNEEGLRTALQAIKDRLSTTRSIARQQAGMPAEAAPPKTDSGGGGGKPLSDADRKQAQDLIAKDGRDSVISHLKANGYDTSGL